MIDELQCAVWKVTANRTKKNKSRQPLRSRSGSPNFRADQLAPPSLIAWSSGGSSSNRAKAWRSFSTTMSTPSSPRTSPESIASTEYAVDLTYERCDHENVIEQMGSGIPYWRMPVREFDGNRAWLGQLVLLGAAKNTMTTLIVRRVGWQNTCHTQRVRASAANGSSGAK